MAAKDALAAVNSASLTSADARRVLVVCKPAIAALSAAQTAAARVVAGTERHGDGGAQVLADAAGLTRHDARSQIKTAEVLQAAPVVRDAVESGRVPRANAHRLADAISKTDPQMVESDSELLELATSMRPEQFVREARRWAAARQLDGGEGDYRRMRARRSVRIFDGDDGMMHLRGELDPVTGRRIANRLNREARRLHSADQRNVSKSERRSLPQCLADALDNLTAGTSDTGGPSGKPAADICVTAHVDEETGQLIGELPDGSRLPSAVLDELTCNAVITGVVFDRKGKAIWKTAAGRDATETQRRLLKARWGGCFHCGANFAICQPHHIDPVSRGGRTHVENLVPACWACHDLIHRHGWQIAKSPDGNHTMHPPRRTCYGPAHAPEHHPAIVATPPLFADEPAVPEPSTSPPSTASGPPTSRHATTPNRPTPALGTTSGLPPPSEPFAEAACPGAAIRSQNSESGPTRPGPASARAALHAARRGSPAASTQAPLGDLG